MAGSERAPAEGTHTGPLIVNADDWGGFRAGTDAIEQCFVAGAISSATAMVHMADSRRAAELARARGRPIGLHLNLTQLLDGPSVPVAVRERQRQLCAHFADLRRRRWLLSPDPRVHRLIAAGIADQLEEFRRLYAVEPTHVDSHHHVHVCPDVFLSRALARGTRVRQTLSPPPDVARARAREGGELARALKHALLARRFRTTERFWRAREISQAAGAVPIADVVRCAAAHSVEVMVHPSFADERAALLADEWLAALGGAPLGSYAAL
jgi:predicted glycoside hydrolase/deacetylase ChbG (UPF0249 family)